MYFFEQLLKRISVSKYSDFFVLKGGFLLENIVGFEHRTTLDLDFSYRQYISENNVLIKEIEDIIKIDVEDNIEFKVMSFQTINEVLKYE